MKISLVSSSIRKVRNSHRITCLLEKEIISHGGSEAVIIDLREENIPLFSERYIDMINPPWELRSIFEKIKSSDGVIFITPEHNGGISAALKSMIDIYGSALFSGKPIGVASVSTGIMGGIRAAQSLQLIILAINGYPFPKIFLVGEVEKQVDETGTIINADMQAKLNIFLHPFLAFVKKQMQIDALV